MTGASFAAPTGRCHHKGRHERGGIPELFAMMGRGRGFGPGPGGPGGPGDFRGGGHRGPRGGRRARRGDIRSAILLLLAEEPRNGYGLMQEIEERSGGVWRPSPGSVYPALSQLEDEGLVRATEHEGRKSFTLTDEGTAHVEANRERYGTPWETVGEGAHDELHELRHAAQALAIAAMQVAQTGTKDQLGEAKAILEESRRRLYRLLAGDAPDEGDEQ
jgi:DNA-binding PadR family transcriptional regulator